eukprot:1443263-Pleurochrysis_carterae.AAC.1
MSVRRLRRPTPALFQREGGTRRLSQHSRPVSNRRLPDRWLGRWPARAARTPTTSVANAGGSAGPRTCATCNASRAVVKQRGRWESDVAEVYQRALVDAQLD